MGQIVAHKLSLGYGTREVIRGIDLRIDQGEFISIIGPSGVGKSTLLVALNGTTSILAGSLRVLGEQVGHLGPAAIKRLRAQVGVIFQCCNLVPRLRVLDNVASGMLRRKSNLSALFKHYSIEEYREIMEYLQIVGMEGEVLSRSDRLSGGQKQRVAIARAIAQQADIILADEPISSLDPVSARRVMETLRDANRTYGMTVVANLHQLDYARDFCNRVIGINDGRIIFDDAPAALTDAIVQRIYGSKPAAEWAAADAAIRCPMPRPAVANA